MNKARLIADLKSLMKDVEDLGGNAPSSLLLEFVTGLENQTFTISTKTTRKPSGIPRKPRKTAAGKKDPAAVANTISELSSKLRAAFESDEKFERTVQDLEESGLTKASVIEVYNAVFDTRKSFPKSVSKDALLKALRKDRIAKVRAAS
ncbi:hypothetical protein [Hyphomonas chukchiensis]|uniref:Uncharacterized protein n=1 Tax=Hyphomonas chukchiensis TaxID=1280947 RepID=A0A062UEL9_9PROT|nr:hypothetical protein [Hyphomonas chukchiensis]KCZ56752.1 hypothetical protein HY30_06440 [Hyphomonas chukchiensis]